MTMTCTICNDPSRVNIDRMLVQGKSYQSIAREYGVSAQAVRRHRDSGHINRQMIQAIEHGDILEGQNLLSEIDGLIVKTKTILNKAEKKNKLDTALRGIAELRSTYELLSKIAFSLHDSRCKELELAQLTDGGNRKEEEAEFAQLVCDRLDKHEISLYSRLLAKINGESDESITLIRVGSMYRPTDKRERAGRKRKPYKDMAQSQDTPTNGARELNTLENDPKTMTRTKKPEAQGVRKIESVKIPGPTERSHSSARREAGIARKKSGINSIVQRANAKRDPTLGATL